MTNFEVFVNSFFGILVKKHEREMLEKQRLKAEKEKAEREKAAKVWIPLQLPLPFFLPFFFFFKEKIEKSVKSRKVLIVFDFVIFIIFLLYNPESILICLGENFLNWVWKDSVFHI